MTLPIAATLPRLLGPAAIAAALLISAPAAHAEADGSPHAWLTSGTPLRSINAVWVRQEGSEEPSQVTVKTTIKVGSKTIATVHSVTSPAISIFETVPVTVLVPADTLAAAKKAAVKAHVTDAQVTFRTSVTYPGRGTDGPVGGTDSVTMPVMPGIRVGHQQTSGVAFTTGKWPRVALSKSGVAKFAPVTAGTGCTTVITSRVDTIANLSNLRGQLGNAKVIKHGSTPLAYVIGTLEGGVPRLVNGAADNAPPIVRALAAVRIDSGRTKVLKLEARADASCTASKTSTDAAIAALQQVLLSAHPAS